MKLFYTPTNKHGRKPTYLPIIVGIKPRKTKYGRVRCAIFMTTDVKYFYLSTQRSVMNTCASQSTSFPKKS